MSRNRGEHPWLIRTVEGFVPASDYDREICGKWGVGAHVRAAIVMPRSEKQNRWYRGLVRTVWKHQEHYKSPDALHFGLKVRLGYVDEIVLHDGSIEMKVRSTSYDDMEQGAFNEYVQRTLDLIQTEIIPGLDAAGRKALVAEVEHFLGGT